MKNKRKIVVTERNLLTLFTSAKSYITSVKSLKYDNISFL